MDACKAMAGGHLCMKIKDSVQDVECFGLVLR